VNVLGVENICKIAKENKLEVVHISSDYVFDGEKKNDYSEEEIVNPKNIYGLHKALSEKIIQNNLEKYYLIRTSWVVGEGKNFVNTMLELSKKIESLNIVNDQIGRPTFSKDLADFIKFIINKKKFGIYNFSNDGKKTSWADFARVIFKVKNLNTKVNNVTTEDYFADKVKNNIKFAKRPKNSVFDLSKVKSLNYEIPNWEDSLFEYLQKIK
jgi:dTDP-4-dehydrorhamnose reductase